MGQWNQGKAGKKEFGRLGSSPLSSLSSCLPSSASPSSVTLLIWGLGSSKQDSEATSYTCGRTDAACGWERLFRGLAVVFPHLAKVLSKQKYGCLLWTLVIQFSLRSQSSLSFPITSDQGAYVIGTKHLFGMGPFSISNVHEDSRVAAFMREATQQEVPNRFSPWWPRPYRGNGSQGLSSEGQAHGRKLYHSQHARNCPISQAIPSYSHSI